MSDLLKRRAIIGGAKSLIPQHKRLAMGLSIIPFVGSAMRKAKKKAQGGIVKKKT